MKGRLIELDLVRSVSIIAVLMIHVSSFYPWFNKSFSWTGFYVFYQITSFAVPAFIMLSGLLTSMNSVKREFKYFEFIRSRFLYIFLPYCFWSIAYFAYRHDTLTYNAALKDFITGRPFFHLYFIAIIIQLYILFPLFLYAAKRFNAWHLVPAVLLQVFATYLYKHDASWLHGNLGATFFVGWILCFYIGCVIGCNYETFKDMSEKYSQAIIGVIAAFSVYKIGDYYYAVHHAKIALFYGYSNTVTLSNLFYATCIVSACVALGGASKSKAYEKAINVIAINSFGMYLCHLLVIRAIKFIFSEFKIESTNITVTVVLFVTVVLSIAITSAIGKFKLGKYAVGKRG